MGRDRSSDGSLRRPVLVFVEHDLGRFGCGQLWQFLIVEGDGADSPVTGTAVQMMAVIGPLDNQSCFEQVCGY